MNTTALEKFAPAIRNRLIEAVGRKLDYVLSVPTPDYRTTYARQVRSLRELERQGRQELLERVAYTWFNRLTALRFLDARGWHPFYARVLTAASAGETQPELLKATRAGQLPQELREFTRPARLEQLQNGQIPSEDPQGELYRELVLAASRYYHGLLPDVFERLDDETELLLPDDLLTEQSVVQGFRTEITDADCETVEVIGWLYQFYISEKKSAVMKRKAAVPTEDIPAVTQLFTPHWIVRYLVENSLGRLWLLNRPGSGLRAHMPYYIEGEPETEFLRIEGPQDIKVLDPAVGSGHMLTYAFDLLYLIYEEEGYASGDIPGLILANNLHGLDICPRAAQLAEMALVFKAREKSRRFLGVGQVVRPMVLALQDVAFSDDELKDYVGALGLGKLFDAPMRKLLGQFEQATTFGSLIQPCLDERTIGYAREVAEKKDVGGQLLLSEVHGRVLRVLRQAEFLGQRYHVVLANPPYQEQGDMNPALRNLVDSEFRRGNTDLCCAFMLRNEQFVYSHGFVGMITMQSWMFLVGSSALRDHFTRHAQFDSMVHLGPRAFDAIPGEVVQTTAFVFSSTQPTRRPQFYRLVAGRNERAKEALFLNRHHRFENCELSDFRRIPGSPFAYWASQAVFQVFESNPSFSVGADPCQGLSTGDTARFLRFWHEVSGSRTEFASENATAALQSGRKWFPIDKGGPPRRWYGNNEFVVNWLRDGEEVRRLKTSSGKQRSFARNSRFYFEPGVTWTKVSSGPFACRLTGRGAIFSDAGMKVFASDEAEIRYLACFLNSRVANFLLSFLSETINFEQGNLARLPLVRAHLDRATVACLFEAARQDWNASETSWDFTTHPLLRPENHPPGSTLSTTHANYTQACNAAISQMQALETENNRLFIAAYGLESELTPEVPLDQITLARADPRKDMAAFLSYAVGCMMGRYSLDAPGLILADAGDTLETYLAKVGKPQAALTFTPDQDGIIPVLDGDWFADDIVARTRDFLRATFGDATLRENLAFLEASLGRDLRSYFTTEFYKNHLQTYKKRPIYWLVQSPKKGFACLVYLHRYTRDTLNVVLNSYLRDYLVKLRHHLAHLAQVQANPTAPSAEKTQARKDHDRLQKVLRECEDWERDTLLPLAQQRIAIDLDDGVKVNYLKFGEALAPIAGLAAADEE